MACLDSNDPQFDARAFDAKMNELLSADGGDFFTSLDEVEVDDSFDYMALQQNLLRSGYAYGATKPSCSSDFLPQTCTPCPSLPPRTSPTGLSSLASRTRLVKNPTVSRPILLKKKLRKWKWRTN